MTRTIDLNADLGESFGPWCLGNDEAMLEIVSSANIACGFHAGDPVEMRRAVRTAMKNGVGIGAHPGFDDLKGFGRRRIHGMSKEDLQTSLIYQIGALQAIARSCGATLRHVKIHGALNNMASEDRALADDCIAAVVQLDPALSIMALASTALEDAAVAAGAPLVREVFADRAYNDDGTLTLRSIPGAIIHDPIEAADRVLEMIETEQVTSLNGTRVKVKPETVCVHGDNPAAVAMASAIRNRLEKAGITVRQFSAGNTDI